MSIPEATIKLLGTRRQAMGNVDIWAALKAGGLALNSADPVNTIGAVITRRSQRNGDIVKVGRGIWGLKIRSGTQIALFVRGMVRILSFRPARPNRLLSRRPALMRSKA